MIMVLIPTRGLMGIFIPYLRNLSLLALVPLAALLCFEVLYIIRGIDKEDISWIRKVFGRGQITGAVK